MPHAASKGWLVAAMKLRGLRRALAEHAFALFGLGPMIVVGFYLILEPTIFRISQWLHRGASGWNGDELLAAALIAAAALLAGGLPSAVREVYSLGSGDAYLDALPLRAIVRFHLALTSQILRGLPPWLVVWAFFELLTRTVAASPWDALPLSEMALMIVEVAALQLLAALLLVRLDLFRRGRLLLVAVGLLSAAAAAAFEPRLGWLTGPLYFPAEFLRAGLGIALEIPADRLGWALRPAALAVIYAVAIAAYLRWRDEDCERARRSFASRRGNSAGQAFAKVFGPAVAAQLTRDLRLVVRGFSPVVYVALAAALLFQAAAWTAPSGGWLEPQWRPLFVLLCCALSTVSLSAVAALLLSFQAPYLWIEQSAGVAPETFWKTKNRLALALSAPVLLSTVVLLFTLAGGPGEAAFLSFRAALVWLSVATVIGTLAFEIAPAPVLGLLLGGVFSVGLAGFYALDDLWPIGLFLYAYVMNELSERATAAAADWGSRA